MTFKKLTTRVAAVLTVAAFAAPALPCTDAKQTHATSTPAPAATPAPATTTSKDTVAKQTPRPEKSKQQGKTGTASKRTATN